LEIEMMRIVQNLRIGTKLAIASGSSILLVVLMVSIQLTGNGRIRAANENAATQERIVQDAVDARAAVRTMTLGVRDIRLARTLVELEKASNFVEKALSSVKEKAEHFLKLSLSTENSARIEQATELAINYVKRASEIVAMRTEAIGIDAKRFAGSSLSSDDSARRTKLEDDTDRFAREITLPLAEASLTAAEQAADFAHHRAEATRAVATDEMVSTEKYSMSVGLGVGIVLIATCIFSIVTIARPMRALSRSMLELANGNFQVVLPGVGRKDEIGDVAGAVETFKVKAAEKARNEAILDEERRQAAEQNKAKALKEMAETVERETNSAVGQVAAGTGRMAKNASLLSDSALLLEKNSSSVAAAAEEALANAQTVAKASSQLSTSIAEIASQVNSSRELTLEAVSASTQAQVTIAKLSEAAGKVGAVTNLISEIAGQTNLLALNATIEAARAGEAGRGFAVVAGEVKSLAEQTAKATSEIARQITEIQDATRASVESIKGIGEVIRNVDAVSSTIAKAIEEQNIVTVEISRTVEETSLAAREVASQIISVSNEATETGRRAAEIRDGSADIASNVDELRATLVRVIRTSTSDVDRRISSRIDLGRPATLKSQGKSARVTVRDLSLGGAMINETCPGVPVNAPIQLVIDGIAAELNGFMARKDADAALLEFELSGQASKIVSELISGHKAAA
jgi:methyl-accepting chemotaxis protein